eukprot:6678552-Prymnesium_polylepis.1
MASTLPNMMGVGPALPNKYGHMGPRLLLDGGGVVAVDGRGEGAGEGRGGRSGVRAWRRLLAHLAAEAEDTRVVVGEHEVDEEGVVLRLEDREKGGGAVSYTHLRAHETLMNL